ncbi:sarcosine oxidase subunit delta [Burkholderia lata]|uniref:Sarcosine oxidase subunit delta n=1 Tax=Burkholderia lata (strain ATCC 17760 / DSM 23089 / LMG 22485 / NCIMB 9086 / R18194 / 383) TaxID=482957 RepID=A0A6P2SMA2_BURL3|nr:sarcosine oxidase subunit delta [Burkholderia lata]VWC51066.1 sarcosine oxidase subunit delta [Burkholderia lata]
MLLITCPYCGPRAEIEFRCGGEGHITRPGPHDAVSDEAWADYLFYRANPKGEHRERWLHSAGCGRWFNLARDTVTHRIAAVYPMGQTLPEGVLA